MFLIFDIGGTKMRFSKSDGNEVVDVKYFDTPQRVEDVFNIISEFKLDNLEAAVGGLPGVFDKEKSKLLRAPNLPYWIEYPIKDKFRDFFQTNVYFENDSALAGLGESVYGSGKDYGIVGYMSIGTGVGGARIVNKNIDQNRWGFEPGHQVIDADNSVWTNSENLNRQTQVLGSLESFVSGLSLERRFGKKTKELNDPEIWSEVERLVAIGLNNTIAYWSPDVIVLGGGLILEKAISIENIKQKLLSIIKICPELPEIVPASLGDLAGLYGGLAYLKGLTKS